MKQLLNGILTSLLLLVVWAPGAAYAQQPAVIRVNIPFEFSVGDKTFPSGDYSLAQPLQHLLVLRDARGRTIASTFTEGVESSQPPAVSKLTFYSQGGQNVLAEVWREDDSNGNRLFPSRSYHRDYMAKRRSAEARQAAEGSQP